MGGKPITRLLISEERYQELLYKEAMLQGLGDYLLDSRREHTGWFGDDRVIDQGTIYQIKPEALDERLWPYQRYRLKKEYTGR